MKAKTIIFLIMMTILIFKLIQILGLLPYNNRTGIFKSFSSLLVQLQVSTGESMGGFAIGKRRFNAQSVHLPY